MITLNKKIEQFEKALEIKNEILGIHFLEKLPKKFEYYKDTACTALARAFLDKKTIVFNAKNYPQLCSGANYFLKLSKINKKNAIDVYIEKEHVFRNKNICNSFLQQLPKFPISLKNKSILIKPFKNKNRPQVIILLINPAQAGRVLGLLNYDQSEKIEIIPNQPTCVSLFAPLVTEKLHINFIDYYDRYHQGIVSGKKIWDDDQMILSLRFCDFEKVLDNLTKSPQGSFKPTVSPQRVDKI